MENQRINTNRKTPAVLINNSGSVLLMTLLLTPVLLATFSLFFSIALLLTQHTKIQHLCYKHVLLIQKQNQRNLMQLLSLNPKAQKLRQELSLAQKKYKIALSSKVPHLIAAAKANLIYVRIKQGRMALKQKQIFIQNRLDRSFWQNQLVHQAKEELTSIYKIKNPALAVKAKPRNSITPSYFLKNNFSQKQTTQFSWKFLYKKIIPHWIYNFLQIPTSYKQSCAATIFRKDNQWTTKLIADK